MASEIYEKKELRQHIYDTPDTYVGGIECLKEILPIYFDNKIIYKEIEYIPALLNIFNEILVNARDQIVRLNQKHDKDKNFNKVTTIKINFNPETNNITVYNDGDGISVSKHEKEKIYIPQLIFGELLTSSNYNKDEKKIVGGKNGYGAKLANIFSNIFTITTVDCIKKFKYTQTWNKNMTQCNEPTIRKFSNKPFTEISWNLDFKRFGIDKYSDDMLYLMYRRVYDLSGITDKSVNVYLNDKKIIIKSFMDYVNLYPIEYNKYQETISDRWDVIVSLSNNDTFEHVSFVNGIFTSKGGSHVDNISKQLISGIHEFVKKTHKKDIPEKVIKRYISIYINSVIENPSFDSQTKERCITSQSKFGSKPCLSKKFIKNVCSDEALINKILDAGNKNDNKLLKSTDGKKKNKIIIPKLDDANWAGTKKSHLCTLILTEGDSAKSMAISGLSEIGRDKYGVFPLRGKVLNVREANIKQINDNKEIANLKKIIGLESNKKYKDIKLLRYGKIMIMTDQDYDGFHIKGLIINLFHFLWPELLNLDFISYMTTPIIKASFKNNIISFYTITDYNLWKENKQNIKKYNIKYYKGLGTSTSNEAKEYFKQLKVNNYTVDEESNKYIELAFKKTEADNRKLWLKNYDENNILDYNQKNTNVQDFINKELIHFSNSDNARSIGSCIDGLKTSQRKILFSCFKRKLYSEIRVAQLAGYVSEHASYHHGETSLQGAIINMAQNFVGSNNINLLQPNGQFGTRIMGGMDAASPRYIHTELNPIVDLIFPKADFNLLDYINDDGMIIEPQYYIPIIPMVLVNGMIGIGTGFSTTIPQFNPIDIINNIKQKITTNTYKPMNLYYNHFKGKIIKKENQFLTKGLYSIDYKKSKITITELPIGKWTDDYITFLQNLILSEKDDFIIDYENHSNDTEINIICNVSDEFLYDHSVYKIKDDINYIELKFKLTTSKSMNNLHLYNNSNTIQKFQNIYEIMDIHFQVRKNLYAQRKASILYEIKNKMSILEAKINFINEIINETINIYKNTKINIIKQLYDKNYLLIHNNVINKISDFDFENINNEYDYLIKLPIYSLSKDKIDEIEKELEKLNNDYYTLFNKTIEEIWIKELDELLIYYKRNFI
jgi:DNA topoisomerase-2